MESGVNGGHQHLPIYHHDYLGSSTSTSLPTPPIAWSNVSCCARSLLLSLSPWPQHCARSAMISKPSQAGQVCVPRAFRPDIWHRITLGVARTCYHTLLTYFCPPASVAWDSIARFTSVSAFRFGTLNRSISSSITEQSSLSSLRVCTESTHMATRSRSFMATTASTRYLVLPHQQ